MTRLSFGVKSLAKAWLGVQPFAKGSGHKLGLGSGLTLKARDHLGPNISVLDPSISLKIKVLTYSYCRYVSMLNFLYIPVAKLKYYFQFEYNQWKILLYSTMVY